MSAPMARLLVLLALGSFLPACRFLARTAPTPPVAKTALGAVEPLAPSPRLIVGRILAVDAARRFAWVDLASDAPRESLTEGTELTARTADLKATSQLRVSRYVRGRTLGTRVIAGQPAPGDEVVWLAP